MERLEAPWIGEAPDDEEDICYCPVCGEECEQYFVVDYKIIGCDRCIKVYDARDFEFYMN